MLSRVGTVLLDTMVDNITALKPFTTLNNFSLYSIRLFHLVEYNSVLL
jgi:hypothetical protein